MATLKALLKKAVIWKERVSYGQTIQKYRWPHLHITPKTEIASK